MARKFILQEIEQSSMVSTWTDTLYCSVLKNGTLSLRMNKKGEDGSWWSPSIRNIRTPRQFLESLNDVGWGFEEWDIELVLANLHDGHPVFAILVEKEMASDGVSEDAESEIRDLIQKVMRHAQLDVPNGNTNARIFTEKCEEFVRDHLTKKGEAPVGEHLVSGRRVLFGANRATGRKKPRSLSKTEQLICAHAKKAIWKKFEGRPHPQWANASRSSRVLTYVRKYFSENGHLPIGSHDLDGLTVDFPDIE